MKAKLCILLSYLGMLFFSQYIVAESRSEIFTKKEVCFVNDNNIITLSLGRYNGGEGVISSPDKSLKGFPYVIGAMSYGYNQPYVFNLNNDSSQAVLIPYMVGGGTGVAAGDWCLAVARDEHVYFENLGTWHYHCCGPEENYFSLDIFPSFYSEYKRDLRLSFIYEERRKGKTEFIKGEIALKIIITQDGMEASLEPCRSEDAFKIADLLTKKDCVPEWAFDCLSTILPDTMKSLKVHKKGIPSEAVEELKRKIKQFYEQ